MRSNSLVALWSIAKALQIPLDSRVKELQDLPYTLSYVIRKRIQYDNLMELPSENRPSDELIFNSSGDELEEFLESVLHTKNSSNTKGLSINITDIE